MALVPIHLTLILHWIKFSRNHFMSIKLAKWMVQAVDNLKGGYVYALRPERQFDRYV